MYQNKVTIISKSAGAFISLQKYLEGNDMKVCIVPSIKDMFEKYINLPYVLTIVDADSYKENTSKLLSRLHGAKPAPILVLMTESYPGTRLELLRMGATVCMNAETSPEEQAVQSKALIQIYCARDDNLHRETLVFGTTLVINPIYRKRSITTRIAEAGKN